MSFNEGLVIAFAFVCLVILSVTLGILLEKVWDWFTQDRDLGLGKSDFWED